MQWALHWLLAGGMPLTGKEIEKMRILHKIAASAFTVFLASGIAAAVRDASVIESVCCDDAYGVAMEAAIFEGNLKQMFDLLSMHEHGINDVIAIGSRRVEIAGKSATYENDDVRAQSDWNRRQSMGQMGVYNGNAYLGMDSGDLSQMGFNYNTVGTRLRGDYYSIEGNKILGTPLMIAVRARRKHIVKQLLERDANPNVFIAVADYHRGDIVSWNTNPYSYNPNSKIGGPWGCKRSKAYLCALLDCYMKMTMLTGGKNLGENADEDEIAKMLIESGAGFIKDVDDYGRNMLWDVARVGSPYLLSEMVKRGFDINREDNQGNTILDYCLGQGALSTPRFLRKLDELGAKGKRNRSNGSEGEETKKQPTLVLGSEPAPIPGRSNPQCGYVPTQQPTISPPVQPIPDNSVEIAALRHRLLALRMELEDARANREIATLQGTGWASASMHEQQIMQEINECESRIMKLR